MLGEAQQDASTLAEKEALAVACMERALKMEAEWAQLPVQFHV